MENNKELYALQVKTYQITDLNDGDARPHKDIYLFASQENALKYYDSLNCHNNYTIRTASLFHGSINIDETSKKLKQTIESLDEALTFTKGVTPSKLKQVKDLFPEHSTNLSKIAYLIINDAKSSSQTLIPQFEESNKKVFYEALSKKTSSEYKVNDFEIVNNETLLQRFKEKYGLTNETLNTFEPFIKTIRDTQNPLKDDMVSFPMVKVNGRYDLENHNSPSQIKGYEFEQQNTHNISQTEFGSVWMATKAIQPDNVKNIYIFNTATDAMSFYQLHGNNINLENAALVSVGFIARNAQLIDLKQRFPQAALHAAFQNNLLGELSFIRTAVVGSGHNIIIAADKTNVSFSTFNNSPKETFSYNEVSLANFQKAFNFQIDGDKVFVHRAQAESYTKDLRGQENTIKESIGRIEYLAANGRTVENVNYTNKEDYINAIKNELEYNPKGFKYETLTSDPAVLKKIDDAIFGLYGRVNDNSIKHYEDLSLVRFVNSEKVKNLVFEIAISQENKNFFKPINNIENQLMQICRDSGLKEAWNICEAKIFNIQQMLKTKEDALDVFSLPINENIHLRLKTEEIKDYLSYNLNVPRHLKNDKDLLDLANAELQGKSLMLAHGQASERVLGLLAFDKQLDIRKAVSQNPSITDSIKNILDCDVNKDVSQCKSYHSHSVGLKL